MNFSSDLPRLFPTWPTLDHHRPQVPLLATLAMFNTLAAVSSVKWPGKLTHSVAELSACCSFIMTSFFALTLIGIFFRGANMALVLPF